MGGRTLERRFILFLVLDEGELMQGIASESEDALDKAFGIWRDRGIDGLEYQLQIRAEWDERTLAAEEGLANVTREMIQAAMEALRKDK